MFQESAGSWSGCGRDVQQERVLVQLQAERSAGSSAWGVVDVLSKVLQSSQQSALVQCRNRR